jgi:hypothetical protein
MMQFWVHHRAAEPDLAGLRSSSYLRISKSLSASGGRKHAVERDDVNSTGGDWEESPMIGTVCQQQAQIPSLHSEPESPDA